VKEISGDCPKKDKEGDLTPGRKKGQPEGEKKGVKDQTKDTQRGTKPKDWRLAFCMETPEKRMGSGSHNKEKNKLT